MCSDQADGAAPRRSRRRTGGFLVVIVLMSLPFVVVDVVLPLLAGPYLVRSWEIAAPLASRLSFAAWTAVPLLALMWLVGGAWVAARRFRRGAGTRRWLVPVLLPWLAHAVVAVGVNLLR